MDGVVVFAGFIRHYSDLTERRVYRLLVRRILMNLLTLMTSTIERVNTDIGRSNKNDYSPGLEAAEHAKPAIPLAARWVTKPSWKICGKSFLSLQYSHGQLTLRILQWNRTYRCLASSYTPN